MNLKTSALLAAARIDPERTVGTPKTDKQIRLG